MSGPHFCVCFFLGAARATRVHVHVDLLFSKAVDVMRGRMTVTAGYRLHIVRPSLVREKDTETLAGAIPFHGRLPSLNGRCVPREVC